MDGNIIVDGVLASCYAFLRHDLADIAMTTMKYYPEAIGWLFGEENEFKNYVKIALDIGIRILLPYIYQYKNMV